MYKHSQFTSQVPTSSSRSPGSQWCSRSSHPPHPSDDYSTFPWLLSWALGHCPLWVFFYNFSYFFLCRFLKVGTTCYRLMPSLSCQHILLSSLSVCLGVAVASANRSMLSCLSLQVNQTVQLLPLEPCFLHHSDSIQSENITTSRCPGQSMWR